MRPAEIEALIKSRVEADRERCIALLQKYLEQNADDALSWYDLAGCFDFLGRELEAEPRYEKAYELGVHRLPSKDQPGFYVGYGSTLGEITKQLLSLSLRWQACFHTM